jgi:endoglucanase
MKRFYKFLLIFILPIIMVSTKQADDISWIRINLLGYKPDNSKVAIWCSKEYKPVKTFQLVDAKTKKFVFTGSAGTPLGAYGPFTQTYRLNFSKFKKAGRYYLQAGGARSPEFEICFRS